MSAPIVVVKFGGNALNASAALASFAEGIVALANAGYAPVVVHGGGPQIDAMLARLQVPSAGRHLGLRITSAEAMSVVRLVLCGQVGPDIVAAINTAGGKAVGLSGEDGGLMTAVRTHEALGLVGDVSAVAPSAIETLIAAGFIPVIAPIAPDSAGMPHNVNADSVAAAIAVALAAEKLLMLTDVAGLYARWPDQSSLLSRLTTDELDTLLPGLTAGMIPKMRACLAAVRCGVAQAHVLDGRTDAWVAAATGLVDVGTLIVGPSGHTCSPAGTPVASNEQRARIGQSEERVKGAAVPAEWPSMAVPG